MKNLALLMLACLAIAVVSVRAAEQVLEDQRPGSKLLTLPLKLVDGHLVVQATATSTLYGVMTVNLELAFDDPNGLTVFDKMYGWFGMDDNAAARGEDVTEKIEFTPGDVVYFPYKDVAWETNDGRNSVHFLVTRNFDNQLGNNQLAGTLGLAFLKHYVVDIDLPKGTLTLRPITGNAPDTSQATAVVPFQYEDGNLQVSVDAPGVDASHMNFFSPTYDTVIDSGLARKLGHPAGDVPSVKMGAIELTDFVVFEPGAMPKPFFSKPSDALPAGPKPTVLLNCGTNLLQSFRVVVDWPNSKLAFYQEGASPSLVVDRAYFKAAAADTGDAWLEFLKAYPNDRRGAAAAKRLAYLRFNEFGASDDELLQAVQWVIDTSESRRRTERGLPLVEALASMPGDTELSVKAGLLSMKYSRDAFWYGDVYILHRVLGDQYLALGDLQNAWSHYMSAAFVPIEKHPFNTVSAYLGLAHVYEKENRYERAYSRYKAALTVPGTFIVPALQKEIDAALERLKAKIPAEDLAALDEG